MRLLQNLRALFDVRRAYVCRCGRTAGQGYGYDAELRIVPLARAVHALDRRLCPVCARDAQMVDASRSPSDRLQ